MNTTQTQTRFTLHNESVISTHDFMGADTDLEHVISEAERLVIGRRYRALQVRDSNGVVARIYQGAHKVWVARVATGRLSKRAPQEQQVPETLPGIDWSQY